MTRAPARLELLAGVLAVLLVVLAFVVLGGDTPDTKDSAAKVADFYADKHGRQTAASFAIILAAPFLVIFGSALRSALRFVEGPGGTWALVAFAGAIIAATGFLIAGGMHLALTEAADKHYSPDTVRALNALDSDNFPPFAAGMGLIMLGTGAAILRGAGLPRWLGWLSLVLGILTFTPAGFFAFIASGLWTILAAVMLSRPGALDAADGPAAPPAARTPA